MRVAVSSAYTQNTRYAGSYSNKTSLPQSSMLDAKKLDARMEKHTAPGDVLSAKISRCLSDTYIEDP